MGALRRSWVRPTLAVEKLVLCGLIASSALSRPALAGAWLQPEGAHYGKVWTRYMTGSLAFDTEGQTQTSPRFVDIAFNAYGEYGMSQRVTLVGYLTPFLGFARAGEQESGYVGGGGVGARLDLSPGETPWALELKYGYQPSLGAQDLLSEESDFAYVPAFESHVLDAQMQWGHTLSIGWLSTSVGTRWFSATAVDAAITGFAQLGWHAHSDWNVDFHLNLYEPLGDVETTNISGVGQTRYLGFGLGTDWWFHERAGLNVTFEGAFYAESNAGALSQMLGVQFR